MSGLMVFSGNASRDLSRDVCSHLDIEEGKASIDRFSDGEIRVEILENVRGKHVFVMQSTCRPCNDNLMELIIMGDALRRASAKQITAVVPYFGYARQDRRVRSARVPISAKIVADAIASVGYDRLVTVDLHADQIQGFFYMPVDNVYATSVMIEDIHRKKLDDIVVVSPDVGGVVRARATAKRLGIIDLAIIDKRRPEPNKSEVMHVIGDVKGKHCVITDDIIDTGGTLCLAAHALKERGAKSVHAYCTHPVLSGKALENVSESAIDELVVTNTIPLSSEAEKASKIRSLSLSKMLAETIRRVNDEESVSSLFD